MARPLNGCAGWVEGNPQLQIASVLPYGQLRFIFQLIYVAEILSLSA